MVLWSLFFACLYHQLTCMSEKQTNWLWASWWGDHFAALFAKKVVPLKIDGISLGLIDTSTRVKHWRCGHLMSINLFLQLGKNPKMIFFRRFLILFLGTKNGSPYFLTWKMFQNIQRTNLMLILKRQYLWFGFLIRTTRKDSERRFQVDYKVQLTKPYARKHPALANHKFFSNMHFMTVKNVRCHESTHPLLTHPTMHPTLHTLP